MAEQDFDGPKPHLSLDSVRRAGAYAAPKRKMDAKPLRDDYAAHGAALLKQLTAALPHLPPPGADARLRVDGLKAGVLVALETLPPDTARKGPSKIPLTFELPGQDVVILSSRRTADRAEESIVFVPDDARAGLTRRLTDYGVADLGNRERPYVAQFERVERITAAETAKLFDVATDFNAEAPRWWELWVRDVNALPPALVTAARNFGLDVHPQQLSFPDTTVVFIYASARQALAFASRVPGAIEEVRPGLGTIEPFLTLAAGRVTQHDFVHDLAKRIIPARSNAPTVCVMDTGVASAHPLLTDGLAIAIAVDQAWGADDHYRYGGHGTSVVSLALHGDLEHPMGDQRIVELTHTVESVKLLPPKGAAPIPPPSYGLVTQSAVGLIEATRPGPERSFCLASCHPDADSSRPSSWSGSLDQIAAGTIGGELESSKSAARAPKRLVFVAAGNVTGATANQIDEGAAISDPAQSWNALTVGGYTTKIELGKDADRLSPLVGANEVSPYSTSSRDLPTDLLPIKPEVLFEAGNMTVDEAGYCDWHPALSLLAAGNNVEAEPLVAFWATSAAVGLAGHFMGRLRAALPGYWPETYRALMVQSARWPEPIRRKLTPPRGKTWKGDSKAEKIKLLRHVGFGVPQLDLAIASAKNDFTMIAQAEMQPYANGATAAVYNEVHFYDLPWPKTALTSLGDRAVTLRVTLSYFIEPNLTGKGATRPETYRSFGLRFALKKRGESELEFRVRLSQLKDGEISDEDDDEWDLEGEGASEDKDDAGSNWLLGPKAVSAGSLHCDIWRGKAMDLVNHDAIAVHPAPGWWKSHLGKGRQSDHCRYALVLSITADGADVDLYAEASAILVEKAIVIETENLIG